MEISKKEPTYVYALGGLEEIGKNTYVVEHDDEIVLVDAGIKFANASLPGFDGTVANFDYLKNNEDRIHSLIITHGHEDHIGGIPHLLRNVKIKKIFAPPLAAKLIERRISEHKDIKAPPIEVFKDNKIIKTKHFEIDFFRVCHSIPDAFGVCFKTPNGYIASTGDFRFDFATEGDTTDLSKITQVSNRGIDVLLCESTSAEVPGFSESERYILQNIKDYMLLAKGRTFISTFASNLGRVEEIIAIAVSLNKKVCVIGKSMEANVKTSRALGYLNVPESSFVSHKELANYKDNEIVVVLTGSQGEEVAALNMMASRKHQKISLKPSDTIILSSNPIPGNYVQVETMVNKLYKIGLTVFENSPTKRIHSSGHATRSEQQLMIKAINPNYLFPIHGEYKMLKAIQKNAMDVGFDKEKIIIATNGEKLQVIDGVLSSSGIFLDANPNFINGSDISTKANDLLKERIQLSSDGIINIILGVDYETKRIVFSPSITTRGCFYAKESVNLVNKINFSTVEETKNLLSSKNNVTDQELKNVIGDKVKEIVWKWRRKKPLVNVILVNTNLVRDLKQNQQYIIPNINNKQEENEDELVDDDSKSL